MSYCQPYLLKMRLTLFILLAVTSLRCSNATKSAEISADTLQLSVLDRSSPDAAKAMQGSAANGPILDLDFSRRISDHYFELADTLTKIGTEIQFLLNLLQRYLFGVPGKPMDYGQ